MSYGVIYRVSFGFLKIFGEKLQKSKRENLGKKGLLHRGVALRYSVGCPCHDEAEVPKWHPSSTTRCSYCSLRVNFWIFVPKV